MAFLYGINFGIALLLTVLLLRKHFVAIKVKENVGSVVADYWLLICVAVSASIFLLLAIGSQFDSLPLSLKLFAGGSGFMLLPAFFFTYILGLVGKSTRWILLFILPFVFHYGWQLWLSADSTKFSFFHGLTVTHSINIFEQWLGVIVYSTQAIFPILGLYQIEKHQQKILDRFSDLSQVDLQWIQRLLWGLLIVLLFAMLMVIPWRGESAVSFEWSLPALFTLVSVQQIYIAYYGLFQSSMFIPSQQETYQTTSIRTATTTKEVEQKNSPVIAQVRVEQLNEFMMTSRVYQQSRLTIDELSIELGWIIEDISDVINKGMGRNFFEFINGYRVNAVIEQMKLEKNQQATLLNIALHCGFNSKTAFNTTFKKITGETPSSFRKKINESSEGATDSE